MSSCTNLFDVLPRTSVHHILESGDPRITVVERLDWWSDASPHEMALTFFKIPAGTYQATDLWRVSAEDPTWAVALEVDGEFHHVEPHATYHTACGSYGQRMQGHCEGIRRNPFLHGALSGLRLADHPDLVRGCIPVEDDSDFDDE